MFRNYGYCYSCNSITEFTAKSDWWRDNYVCTLCGSIPRERALMYAIEKFYPDWNQLVIHESSPAPRATSLRLKNEAPKYISSQFFPNRKTGEVFHGYRCEDLENLSFEENSIDLHITQDVLEHILNPAKAFSEIARTLRPGGAHVFTTPLVMKNSATQWCARRREDGTINYLINPPEYHGNPINNKGSLVTVHWGYDITRYIFEASGLFTQIFYVDSLDLGIRAEYIEVLISIKPP
jgi:SAM-dependent methyltransferase